MWSACSEEARAELKKDERFQEIQSEAAPSEALLGCHKEKAEKAFGMFHHDGSLSLSMFLKEFNAKRAIMNIHECDVSSEIKLAALFTEKLESGRYGALSSRAKLWCQRHTNKQASGL
jgi:hypothetical protein